MRQTRPLWNGAKELVAAHGTPMPESFGADVAVLRDLIDRRPDLNACALRPGQAVHVHALERILAFVERTQKV